MSVLFENMNLHEKLLESIKAQKYTNPTEIQSRVIPLIIDCKDLMASAETGAGKTIAFVLPALQRLMTPPENKQGHGPRVLVLTPTRELAEQVADAVRKMAQFTSIRLGVITGGVAYPAQEQLLRRPLDFLVATPGRLMDHMDRGRIDFSRLELFILDEADRMLDMGFIKDIEKIIEPMPTNRQTLLFSATLEGAIQNIARRFLKNPESVQLAGNSKMPTLIEQRIHQVDDIDHKRALLVHLLEDPEMWQAIVFTATKRSADRLADDLASMNFDCAALHGDMKQSKRTRTLDRMRRGQIRVLIATDVAARGLDVKNISHVINFDLPKSAEDYIHRIGRTGRAGESGIAITFVEPRDWSLVSYIERTLGQRIERSTIVGLEPKGREPKPFEGRKNGSGRPPSGGRSSGYGRSSFNDRSSNDRSSGQGRSYNNNRSSSASSSGASGSSNRRPFNNERSSQNDAPRFARSSNGERPAGAGRFSNNERSSGPSRFSKGERSSGPSRFSNNERSSGPGRSSGNERSSSSDRSSSFGRSPNSERSPHYNRPTNERSSAPGRSGEEGRSSKFEGAASGKGRPIYNERPKRNASTSRSNSSNAVKTNTASSKPVLRFPEKNQEGMVKKEVRRRTKKTEEEASN